MTLIPFASAVLALLLAPGPTNTLMGLAGAQGGMRWVARLIPAELAGYLSTVLPLAFLGHQALARWPAAGAALKLVAAGWVGYLAIRLWQRDGSGAAPAVIDRRRIFVTTMLNPKALVFGLVLLPAPWHPGFAGRLMLFCVMVAGAAALWGAAGRLTTAGPHPGRLRLVQRAASIWLGVVAVTLMAGAVGA